MKKKKKKILSTPERSFACHLRVEISGRDRLV